MPESKYAYDEESVKAIIEWAQTTQLPKEVMLSEAEHIFDTSMYVNANICDIKQHCKRLSKYIFYSSFSLLTFATKK